MYNEIMELITSGNYDENDKLNLLIELYRYAFYNTVKTSFGPRGDIDFKSFMLIKIKNSLFANTISKDLIDSTKRANDYMREHIDSPIELIESEIKFYSENPGAKF